VWLVDLSQDLIEVYARPVKGAYREFQQLKRGESVVARTIAGLTLRVDRILG